MAEQLTLNQPVLGSNPRGLTNTTGWIREWAERLRCDITLVDARMPMRSARSTRPGRQAGAIRCNNGMSDRGRTARNGEVSELADERDLGSRAARRRSSSLLF